MCIIINKSRRYLCLLYTSECISPEDLMLDIKFVRENPDAIDTAMANRQTSWDREKFFDCLLYTSRCV